MLTIKQTEQALGEKASAWKGRCFEIASALITRGAVKGRAVYGHYRGCVHPRSMFYRTSGLGWVQHGWVELEDGRVLDPTRWCFENKRPYIYIGDASDYDEGGNVWRMQQAGPPPPYEEFDETVKITKAIMDGPIWTLVEKLLRIDVMRQEVGVLTIDQLRWLAHVPPPALAPHAKAVYTALEKLDMGAFIPIDNKRMVDAKPQYSMGTDVHVGTDDVKVVTEVIARLDGGVLTILDERRRTKMTHPSALVHRGRGRRSNG